MNNKSLTPLGDVNSPLSFVRFSKKGVLQVTLTHITRSELAIRLKNDAILTLLAVLPDLQYRTGRIPGSLRFTTLEEILEAVPIQTPIIIYCKGPSTLDAEWAYRLLYEHGYSNLCIYPGGLSDWIIAGLPIAHDVYS